MIVQAEAGIDNEGLVVGRTLHEASNILMAFLADPGEDSKSRFVLRRQIECCPAGICDFLNSESVRGPEPSMRLPSNSPYRLDPEALRTPHI
jgi:hypothetical protein